MAVKQRVRNAGSSYTTFRYAGQNIAMLQVIQDTGQEPVAQPEFIQVLGNAHPIDIVTPRAIRGGMLTLTILETWHHEVWQQMAGLAGTNDILEVFRRLGNTRNYVTCAKIIRPPDGKRYGKTYHRCTITRVPDGESVNISSLSMPKDVQIAYTHTTPL